MDIERCAHTPENIIRVQVTPETGLNRSAQKMAFELGLCFFTNDQIAPVFKS